MGLQSLGYKAESNFLYAVTVETHGCRGRHELLAQVGNRHTVQRE